MSTEQQEWRDLPGTLLLPAGEVHVWRAVLAANERWLQVLSADEWARANRLVTEVDRQRFIACRCILRAILGRYLQVEPAKIVFCYGPQGKPGLASAALHFNLAHATDLALVAVACDGEVGIDLERLRPMPTLEAMSQRFFTPREADRLLQLPEADRPAAFFHCWARKEAYLKRLGLGLSLPPDQVEVWPGPPPSGALIDLAPGPGYAAALAVENLEARVVCWQWAGECG